MNFKTFRNKETGIEAQYPAHYADHPTFKDLLEPVDELDGEFEEDKVVVDDSHELPVEQRTAKRTTRVESATEVETLPDVTTDKE